MTSLSVKPLSGYNRELPDALVSPVTGVALLRAQSLDVLCFVPIDRPGTSAPDQAGTGQRPKRRHEHDDSIGHFAIRGPCGYDWDRAAAWKRRPGDPGAWRKGFKRFQETPKKAQAAIWQQKLIIWGA